jgi:hypothetical protein
MGKLWGFSTRTNVNQKLALLDRQRACRPAQSALFRTTGMSRFADRLGGWPRYSVPGAAPQAPRKPPSP